MEKGMKYFLSIILLFSFSCIGIGFFLSYENKIIDPVDDILLTVDKSELVNITNNGDEKKPDNATTTQIAPSSPSQSDSSLISTSELTVDDINDKLRSELQDKYGITIKYGTETEGYSVGGMSTSIISDSVKVNRALSDLSNNLSNYPEGFFKEFNSIGLQLTIYLIDTYSEADVTGVTDPSSNDVVISIATYYPFSESFNHETYHYMERYMKIKGGTFTSWTQYNPLNFRYGSLNSTLSFDKTNNSNSYFVNDYAQTSENEDRASTFEYMMADTKASCINYNLPIWNKANYMAKVIDIYFKTVNSSTVEYWERFL